MKKKKISEESNCGVRVSEANTNTYMTTIHSEFDATGGNRGYSLAKIIRTGGMYCDIS